MRSLWILMDSVSQVNLLGNPGCGDETTGQVMLLACRCLYNVVDILQGAQSGSWWAKLGQTFPWGRVVPRLMGIYIPISRVPIVWMTNKHQQTMNPTFWPWHVARVTEATNGSHHRGSRRPLGALCQSAEHRVHRCGRAYGLHHWAHFGGGWAKHIYI